MLDVDRTLDAHRGELGRDVSVYDFSVSFETDGQSDDADPPATTTPTVVEFTHRPWFRWARAVVIVAVLGLAGTISMRVLARITWLGDALAIGLPIVAACALLASVICVAWPWPQVLIGTVAVFLCTAWAVVAPRVPQRTDPPSNPIRIAAANLQFDSQDARAGFESALDQRADILAVSELTRRADRRLSSEYAFSATTWGPAFGQGVYSNLPFETLEPPSGFGNQALKVQFTTPVPLVLYAVHLPRPGLGDDGYAGTASIATHRALVQRLDGLVRSETEATVVAGDLNLADRTTGYRLLATGRVDVARAGEWADSTYERGFPWWFLRLRIDYVFVPGSWCSADGRSFEIAGSDHRGVVAEIGLCGDA